MRFFRVLLPALLLGSLLLLLPTKYAAAYPSHRSKDLPYVPTTAANFDAERHLLDVYQPKHAHGKALPVVVFIHGGSWNSGSKNLYSFIGRRLAKQGVVAVLLNYRLAPKVQVPAMAHDCARAVAWTVQHIAQYGGDPQRVFVLGHSAGGGLAALLATKDALFTDLGLTQNPVRGAILDDPAGLDMYDYLQKMQYPGDEQYLVPFGKEPAVWRQVSPMYFVRKSSPPFLLFVGGNTYPSIQRSSAQFRDKLQALGQQPGYTVLPGKKHIPMVLQLYWKNNIIYQQLLKLVGA